MSTTEKIKRFCHFIECGKIKHCRSSVTLARKYTRHPYISFCTHDEFIFLRKFIVSAIQQGLQKDKGTMYV